MARSKYINTFDTTADYNNYIESAYPEFPNVGYDKQAGEVKIIRTSPNSHLFYGELVDATQNIPQIKLMTGGSTIKTYTPTVDTLTNEFYIDDWGTVPTFNKLDNFLTNKTNIKTIKKFKGLDTSSVVNMSAMFDGCLNITSLDLSNFNTSNVTDMGYMFGNCNALTSLDLSNFNTSNVTNMNGMFGCRDLTLLDISNWDTSNVTHMTDMFNGANSLKDVYITVEATLMKLTNNLTSQGGNYIPSNNGKCTIHYNDTNYKWQNRRWTPQS